MAEPPNRSVALFGATGLIGNLTLEILAKDDHWERISVVGRRRLSDGPSDPRIEERVIDFADLESEVRRLEVDAIICALGTTIKKAGSRERFREVDYDYPVTIARGGREVGVRHFLLVSAIGADAGSRIFYNRVKGEVERDLQALDFPALTIVRPSLLLGHRDEFRLGEALSKWFMRMVPGRYRAIQAATVARALVHEARRPDGGSRIFESDLLRRRFG